MRAQLLKYGLSLSASGGSSARPDPAKQPERSDKKQVKKDISFSELSEAVTKIFLFGDKNKIPSLLNECTNRPLFILADALNKIIKYDLEKNRLRRAQDLKAYEFIKHFGTQINNSPDLNLVALLVNAKARPDLIKAVLLDFFDERALSYPMQLPTKEIKETLKRCLAEEKFKFFDLQSLLNGVMRMEEAEKIKAVAAAYIESIASNSINSAYLKSAYMQCITNNVLIQNIEMLRNLIPFPLVNNSYVLSWLKELKMQPSIDFLREHGLISND